MLVGGGHSVKVVAADTYLNNADVMPLYKSDRDMKLEKSDDTGLLETPDWLKTAIMVEVRIQTCTSQGTLESAVSVLDHYQEMGVNCLWIAPVAEPVNTGSPFNPSGPNSYTNKGPQTIDPAITGTTDYTKGWQIFAWFVRQAHKRNIHILLDMVTWGVGDGAPLAKSHPEFFGARSGYGGPSFNWKNKDLCSWFETTLGNIVTTTDVDGFRCDCEPDTSGYDVYGAIRKNALAKGHKIVLMSEGGNERMSTYDLEQNGVTSYTLGGDNSWTVAMQYEIPKDWYLDYYNIVDSIKSGSAIGSYSSQQIDQGGTYRFYTNCLSNHDYWWTTIRDNLLRIGYQAIFAPFIPLWYMGDEMGTEVNASVLYFSKSYDPSSLNNSANRQFYETLKKYIRIRRLYPDIFNDYPMNHQNSNICKVNVGGLESLQAYGRYDSKGNGILIVPNNNLQNPNATLTVTIPFADMKMGDYKRYTVTNLLTGEKIVSGTKSQIGVFETKVDKGAIGVYLVSGGDKVVPTVVGPVNTSTQAGDSYTSGTDTVGADTETSSESSSQVTSSSSSGASSGISGSSVQASSVSSQKNVPATQHSADRTGLVVGIVIAAAILVLGGAAAVLLVLRKRRGLFHSSKE